MLESRIRGTSGSSIRFLEPWAHSPEAVPPLHINAYTVVTGVSRETLALDPEESWTFLCGVHNPASAQNEHNQKHLRKVDS
jgi:hypothetical protein